MLSKVVVTTHHKVFKDSLFKDGMARTNQKIKKTHGKNINLFKARNAITIKTKKKRLRAKRTVTV